MVVNISDDTIITDPDAVLGENWLDYSDESYDTVDSVYIRNEILGVDFSLMTFSMSSDED